MPVETQADNFTMYKGLKPPHFKNTAVEVPFSKRD